jgi:hypothetical protein
LCDFDASRQSPSARLRVVRFANLALGDLLDDAPYLFRSDQRRFAVPQGLVPLASETFTVAGDAWLLLLTGATAAGIAQWRLDGTHCTQTIYLTDTAGTTHKRTIQGVANIGGAIYVTITSPWDVATETGLTWEVKTQDFYLPKEMEDIHAVRVTDVANTWHRDVRLISEFEGRDLLDGLYNGRPWQAYPGGDIQIPTLTGMTSADRVVAGAWSTADFAAGAYEYKYTVSWGKRPEYMSRPSTIGATTGRLKPLIESPPSAVLTHTSTAGSAVDITLPDVRKLLAQTTGTRSDAELVAYKINVYRATSGKRFLLWQTIDAGTLTATDDGSIIPDYFTQLPQSPGVRSLTFDSIPAEEIIIDGLWDPPELVHDDDAPPLDKVGVRALVELTAERVFRKLSNAKGVADSRARYSAVIGGTANKDGSGRDSSVPRRRRTRRVGGQDMVHPIHTVDYDYGN